MPIGEIRLRFLMVTTFYPPYSFGGDGIYVYRLSDALARRGHSVDIVHCVNAYRLFDRSKRTDEYAHHPNIRIHKLDNFFS